MTKKLKLISEFFSHLSRIYPNQSDIDIDRLIKAALNTLDNPFLAYFKQENKSHLPRVLNYISNDMSFVSESMDIKYFPCNQILYVKILDFLTKVSYKNLKHKLKITLQVTKNATLILDLRGSGGGDINEAIKIAGILVGKKNICFITKKKKQQAIKGKTNAIPLREIHVIVDSVTKSSAELLTYALHENKIATVWGKKTYGKSSLYNVIMLPGDRYCMVPIGTWKTSKKIDIQPLNNRKNFNFPQKHVNKSIISTDLTNQFSDDRFMLRVLSEIIKKSY